MPFKTQQQRREWNRKYNAKNPDKVARWDATERSKDTERSRATFPARQAARWAKERPKAFALLDRVVADLKREAMKREGVMRCCKCKRLCPRGTSSMCAPCRSVWHKTWRVKNPDKYRAASKRATESIKKDVTLRTRKAIRQRMQKAIRRYAEGVVVESGKLRYLGCTVPNACAYLEQQFKRGMTWGNYGKAWHIDHIAPCASFDLTTEDGRRRAFHYTNLQPLWAKENYRKNDKRPDCHMQTRLTLPIQGTTKR
jgi:hypothetical protein